MIYNKISMFNISVRMLKFQWNHNAMLGSSSDIEDKQKKTHYVAKEKYVFQLNFKSKQHLFWNICQFMKH